MSKQFGSPPDPTTDVPTLAPRASTTHKGQVGRVAIVAGSRGMSGAATLCGQGALRGGAGLVRVYTPESVWPIVAANEPCMMTVPIDAMDHGAKLSVESHRAIDDGLKWADVFAVGPGIGDAPEARLILGMCMQNAAALVVDADGLNRIAEEISRGKSDFWEVRRDRATVLTPHPGEMARLRKASGLPELSGDDDDTRLRIAHEYACYASCTVVLKGHRTVVCTPDQAYINTTGNPGMATGGMGDVLTGLVAALLGQGLDALDAARLAVHTHGKAADLCAERIGPVGYLASDVTDAIPAALAESSRPQMGFT